MSEGNDLSICCTSVAHATMLRHAMTDSDIKYWVALNRIPGIGRVRFSLLEKHFGRLENAWTATAAELKAAALDEKTIDLILAQRPKISPDE